MRLVGAGRCPRDTKALLMDKRLFGVPGEPPVPSRGGYADPAGVGGGADPHRRHAGTRGSGDGRYVSILYVQLNTVCPSLAFVLPSFSGNLVHSTA